MTYAIYYDNGNVTSNEKTGVFFPDIKLLAKTTVNSEAELNNQINLISENNGLEKEYIHAFMIIDRSMLENLYKLLDYCYYDEEKDFECSDKTNHIFNIIKLIGHYINYQGMHSIDTCSYTVNNNHGYKNDISDIEKFLNEINRLSISEHYTEKCEENAFKALDNLKKYSNYN